MLGLASAFALAQAQWEETILVGQVQSVDETGTGRVVCKEPDVFRPAFEQPEVRRPDGAVGDRDVVGFAVR